MQNQFFSFNVQQEMEFQIGNTLPAKSCATGNGISNWLPNSRKIMENFHILYYYDQCKTSSFDNSISYGEQEIDFQFGSILPVKSCKFASLSYSFRAKHCKVYNLLNSLLLLSIQNQFLSFFKGATGNGILNW